MGLLRRVVLVTGASSGLGLALAKRLIESDQYVLVLTARPKSLYRFELEGIRPGPNVVLLPLGVTSAEDRKEVIKKCESILGGVDVLINNAGIAMRSVVEDASASDRLTILEVNYIGPMRLTALVLPSMRRKRSGKIINISSAAGLVGMPTMACYCGSKFALDGATESLWYEVRPWNIKVSLIIPGFIKSDSFLRTVHTQGSKESVLSKGHSPYFRHYLNMEKLIGLVMRRAFSTPESIANKIVRVIEAKNPSLRVPVTFDAWLLFIFRRFLPRAIYHSAIFKALPHSGEWGQGLSAQNLPRSSANSI